MKNQEHPDESVETLQNKIRETNISLSTNLLALAEDVKSEAVDFIEHVTERVESGITGVTTTVDNALAGLRTQLDIKSKIVASPIKTVAISVGAGVLVAGVFNANKTRFWHAGRPFMTTITLGVLSFTAKILMKSPQKRSHEQRGIDHYKRHVESSLSFKRTGGVRKEHPEKS